jgi:hypothetical protein
MNRHGVRFRKRFRRAGPVDHVDHEQSVVIKDCFVMAGCKPVQQLEHGCDNEVAAGKVED